MSNQQVNDEIEKIKRLRADYDKLAEYPNSEAAIEAYLKWYEESCVVFSHYFDEDNNDFVNFKNVVNHDTNGYRLKDNYQRIRKSFCVLLDKLERNDWNQAITSVATNASTKRATSGKRIFISHASIDKELVSKFVDSILLLGLGLESETIAYTSREDTGVMPGESIPQFIQNNIACADVVLLMISDNYKGSEVCLNEMGAAWALDKHIIQILMPNTSFNKLGWLESLNKAIKIDSDASMDRLCEVLSDKLDLSIKPSIWNRNKSTFLSSCALLSTTELPIIIKSATTDIDANKTDELGFLDYREQVDADVQTVFHICQVLTDGINEHAESLTTNAMRLQTTTSSCSNLFQAKEIMKTIARGMDVLSERIEENAPALKASFFSMIDNATKMKYLVQQENEDNMKDEYTSVNGLLISLSDAKSGVSIFKEAIDALPKAEQTINKSKRRLSGNLSTLIAVLDECISKSQDLLKSIL